MNSSKFFIVIVEVLVAVVGFWLAFYQLDGGARIAVMFCTIIYAVITAKLEIHFSEEDSFFNKFPMLNSLKNTDFDASVIKTFGHFQSIENQLLAKISQENWNKFSTEIESLYFSKRSISLPPDVYISYIDEMLSKAKKGSVIKAVSFFHPSEFVPNTFEINFNEAQKKAKERGVTIKRIFVCAPSRMEDLKSTIFWEDHLKFFDSKFADEKDICSSGLSINHGFIMIDNIVFFDRADGIGNLGGIISAQEQDISQVNKDFNTLEKHSLPLSKFTP